MKENIFFTDTHEIGQTQKPIKPMQKMGRGAKVDEISDIKDIAKAIREYVKKKYPKYKFSVNIERYSGGQSLRVNWYQADFNPLVSEEAWGDTKDGKTFSVNQYYFETSEKLTKKAIAVIKDVRDFYQQYNYDYSDTQSDYYNTRFYEDFKVGAWGKPFVQTSGKPEKPRPSKPTGGTEQGIEPPMFSDGQSVIYKTSQGDKEGTIEYSKYVKSQNKYIYGIRTSTNALLTIWESNIRALNTPQETPPSETPSQPETPTEKGRLIVQNERVNLFTKQGIIIPFIDELEFFNYLNFGDSFLFSLTLKTQQNLKIKLSLKLDYKLGINILIKSEFLNLEIYEIKRVTRAEEICNQIIQALSSQADYKFKELSVEFSYIFNKLFKSIRATAIVCEWFNPTNESEENQLPFEVGDVFIDNKEGNVEVTYTITKIDDIKTEFRVQDLKTGESIISSFETSHISYMILGRAWIPYDPLDENPQQQPETPSETKNEAIEELDDELILLNDLRKKTTILQDPDAQKEFREEISSLIDTREIFTEAEKFDVENLISTYFDNAIMNFNLPITSEQLMVDDNEIREITESKDFKDWFGDWENTKYPSSKAIKINTETFQATPMVVYHGTKNPTHYSRFKNDKFPLIYFATNKKYAEWFAQLGNGIIYECFLNVRFPINFMDLGLKDITWQELSEFVKEKYGLELPKFPKLTERRKVWAWIRFDAETNFSLINAIKEAQFDAIIHIENNPQQEDDKGNEEITKAYMIFDPKNVKLVKFAKQTKGFSEIMFLKEGGRLSLMEEIKNLKK